VVVGGGIKMCKRERKKERNKQTKKHKKVIEGILSVLGIAGHECVPNIIACFLQIRIIFS